MSFSFRLKILFEYEFLKLKDHSWLTLIGVASAFLYYDTLPKLLKNYWPQFMGLLPNKLSTILMIVFIHVLSHFLANVFYEILYRLKSPFFEKYKVSSKPWPWDQDLAAWRLQFRRALKQVLSHNLIVFPCLALLTYLVYDPVYRTDLESYPSSLEIISQTIFIMLVDDFYNFWVHRFFHVFPILYNKIHKKHHEFIIPVSLSAEYAHTIEYSCLNVPAPFLGMLILGKKCHYLTVILFAIMKSIEPVEVHSGYEFPWSPFKFIPFGTPAGWHDYHHTHNVGNYSSFFTFWDILVARDLTFIEDIRGNYRRRNEKIGDASTVRELKKKQK